jgi:hypothetical protein
MEKSDQRWCCVVGTSCGEGPAAEEFHPPAARLWQGKRIYHDTADNINSITQP